MSHPKTLDRRTFLKTSAAGVLGAGWAGRLAAGTVPAAGPAQEARDSRPRIQEYRLLGRTAWKVSDLAAGYIQDEGVMRAALDAGVNYIDTAEQYPGHHRLVAKVLKGRDRKTLFLTTKLQVLEDRSREGFLQRARKALAELETDYVDCLMMHMPQNVATLGTEGFHAALSELKAEGRVRFTGVSHHGAFWYREPEEAMDKVLGAAAEDGRFDLFLMAYNFLNTGPGGRVLEAARAKKIGVALMKTTPVAIYDQIKARIERTRAAGQEPNPLFVEGLNRYQAMVDKAQEFIQGHRLATREEIQSAAIRFCLDNPDVHTVCFIARTHDEMGAFLRLSGGRLDAPSGDRLAAFREGCGGLYCRHACGLCEPSCPHGVPVNTIARYYQYHTGQGRTEEAAGLYAAIPGPAGDVCSGCSGGCEKACPYGVPVQGLMILAHQTLAAS